MASQFDFSNLADKDKGHIEYPIEGGFRVRATEDGYHLIESGKEPVKLKVGHERFAAARTGFREAFGAVNAPVDEKGVAILKSGIDRHLFDKDKPTFFDGEKSTLAKAGAYNGKGEAALFKASYAGIVDGVTEKAPLNREGIRAAAAISAHDPKAMHFVTNNVANTINDSKLVNKALIDSTASKYSIAVTNLENLYKNPNGYTAKEIETEIAKAGPGFEKFLNGSRAEMIADFAKGRVAPKGGKPVPSINLNEVFAEVNTKAGNFQREASALADKAKELYDEAMPNGKKAGWGYDRKMDAVKKKVAEFEKLGKENPGYVGYIDDALETKLGKDGLADLRKVPGMETALNDIGKAAGTAETAGKNGAKLLGGGKWYGFYHDAESVGTEVEKIGKFRTGKAVVVAGVAAVTAAVIAAIGHRGPGERAQSVNDSRSMEASPAR